MAHDADAARARAEATFKAPAPRDGPHSAQDEAERALRERTARLREQRLAREALQRKGVEIRASRRREL